jgi:group I intron endonuclease
MSASIYRITNTVNGKCYVGQTIRKLQARWKHHCYDANKYNTTRFHHAIRKYGPDTFTVELLEETTAEQLNDRERYWIAELQPAYNMTEGGQDNSRPDDEVRAKMSDARKGKKFKDEHRAKIGEANRRRRWTPESREKIGKFHRNKKLTPEHREILVSCARNPSAETRAKMSAAQIGKTKSAEHRAKIAAAHRGMPCSPETKMKISETKRRKRLNNE